MSNKLKVFLICSSSNIGGAEKNLFLINKIFSNRRNLDFKVIYLRKTNNKKISFKNQKNFVFFNSNKSILSLFKLISLIDNNNPDMIFSTTFSVNLICIFAKFLSKSKFHLIIRESNNLEKKSLYSSFIEKFFLKFVFLYKYADLIIAPSLNISKQLKDIVNENKVYLIKNIVKSFSIKKIELKDKKLIKKIRYQKKKIILTVGRLEQQKNFFYLLNVFKILKKKNVSLIIIGEGKLFEEIKKYINFHKLNNIYVLRGRENLEYFYKNCDLYVQTSFYEGMPNTVLEAISFNKPILIRKYPGCLTDFKNYGLSLNIFDGNENNFSKKIISIITKKNIHNSLKSNRKRILNNNIESISKYEKILNEKKNSLYL